MELAVLNTRSKWTNSLGGVHFRSHRDGQACATQVFDFVGKEWRPFLDNSRGKLRRGFAGKVLAATGDMDTVAILLGHSSIDCSQRYVDVNHDTLCEMFADAIEDSEC